MKRTYIFLLAILLGVASFGFAGCSDSDDGNEPNGSNGSSSGDYIEVTINGKTYRHDVRGLYASVPTDRDGIYLYASTEDVFDRDGFNVFYSLNCYEDFDRLLQSPTGNHDVVTVTESVDEADNLSLWLDYEDADDYYEIESGSHRVTSIKATKVKNSYGEFDAVQIEGTFDLTMTAEYYTSDSQCKIKGKYRMSIY